MTMLNELPHNEEVYRSLFNNIQSGIIYCRMLFQDGRPIDFIYLMTNDAFNEQSGIKDVVGKRATEVIHGIYEAEPQLFDRFARVSLTGEPERFEVCMALLDRCFSVFVYSPKPEHFIAVFDNITQRKEAEAQKTRLADQLKLALDAAHMGFWYYDPAAEVISFDHRHQEILGLPYERQSRDEILERIHPDDRTHVWEKVSAALDPVDPQPYEAEYRYFMADGSVRWLKAYAMATFKGEGQARHATGLVGTVTDITKQKRAEEEKALLSEQRQLALDAAHMGWWSYDVAADKVTYDERYGQICGFSGEAMDIEQSLARVHPDDRGKFLENVHAALNPGDPKPYEVQLRLVLDDGSVRWIQSHGIATFEGEGQSRHATRMVGTVVDITASKRAEEDLKLAAAVYRDSSEAMMVLDEQRRIFMVNQAFTDITGYAAEEVIGRLPSFLRAGPQDDAIYADLWEQVHRTGRFKGEMWHKKKNGQFIAVQNTTNAISDGKDQPTKYVVLLSDITEKKRSDDMLWSQANYDTLTGLPNRRFFRDRLEHEVRNARRSKLPLALLFMDLDGFKDVNDTLGHDMGDLLLREAADRLRNCVREIDTVARLGGDEFTVILAELHDPGNADRVARHILRALSEPISLGQELAYVSASIGITLYPSDAAEVEELIRNADQAMYEAKQRGKNQYQYFTPAMQKAAIKRMRLVNDMRKALERAQFEILYQPIVELSTGAIRKAEALIRWRHPKRGLVNPVEFISAAEDTGMITAFGDWIFQEAAKQAALWREKFHPDFQISVNISPVQFKKEGIDPALWLEHLKELDLPGQGIVVEITEGLLLDANPKVTEQLLMLRDAGIEVALDDFGTGYSSLAYLKRFDIDYLKIDQAFVQNLTATSDDMALCEAIIVMAHKLGLKVIAEGIETGEQRSLLTNAGCDFAQGYLFCKPVSAEEFQLRVESGPR